MDNFAEHMFTDKILAEQDKIGMKDRFQHVYKNRFTGPLDDRAIEFIQTRTSFYLATVSETGWPYVQYRGGPLGFLKVIEQDTLGFADYLGNKQFISKGNVQTDDRVSIILMDYPRQARLKLIGRMTMVNASEDEKLAEQLSTQGEGPVERVAKIKLTAIDWNCPKYIEQRYTQDEISALVAPHFAKRDEAIEILKNRLRELNEDPDKLLEPETTD